jgi:vancomycin resistance protein YoaR
MPFSLTNAPVVFQGFISSVFSDILDKHVVVYLDDILVFSKDRQSHEKHITDVLKRLRKHKLFANAKNANFSGEKSSSWAT